MHIDFDFLGDKLAAVNTGGLLRVDVILAENVTNEIRLLRREIIASCRRRSTSMISDLTTGSTACPSRYRKCPDSSNDCARGLRVRVMSRFETATSTNRFLNEQTSHPSIMQRLNVTVSRICNELGRSREKKHASSKSI